MTSDEIDKYWKTADRISDRVVGLINEELKATQDPLQVFTGLMLAFMALMRSADGVSPPRAFIAVRMAVQTCLDRMLAYMPRWKG